MAPRYKDDERDRIRSETRRLLMEAATEAFAREGYARANVNHISKSAGFAKGTIYNYFESKRALMLALIDEFAKAHFEFIVEHVEQEGDPERRLERFFEAGFAFVSDYLAPGRVMINTLYGPDADFKHHMYQAYQPMFQFVGREIIARGIAQGLFRQVDPYSTAGLLMTIYLGVASNVDEDGRIWPDQKDVSDFVLRALRKTI